MTYHLESLFINKFKTALGRFQKRPNLRAFWVALFSFLIIACYGGVFFAVITLEVLPFGILRFFKPHTMPYWISAITITLAICGFCGMLGLAFCHHLIRSRHVNIDIIAILLSSLVALWFAVRTFPVGWPANVW